MPVHAISHWLTTRLSSVSLPPARYVAALVALLLLRLITSHRSVPSVPAAHARDLHGKLILIVGGFTPFGYKVLTRLAARGARIVALTKPPLTDREHQLLYLATVASTHANEELYTETCDLSSVRDVRRFAAEWETKAAVRRGALGEEIGRQHLDTLLLLPDDEAPESLELARALLPSLLKPTTVAGAPMASVPTRIIYMLASPFYAAGDALKPAEGWRADAAASLRGAALLLEEQHRLSNGKMNARTGQVACMAVSPGLTRRALLDHARLATRERSTLYWLVAWSFVIVFYPLLWAVGKSGSEAARAVERVIVSPLDGQQSVEASVDVVKPGVLYRGVVDAGRHLHTITDNARRRKLYEADEMRVKSKLDAEEAAAKTSSTTSEAVPAQQ